eukprot:scaffold1735_cov119-Isochrysis_galbana.AAC.11
MSATWRHRGNSNKKKGMGRKTKGGRGEGGGLSSRRRVYAHRGNTLRVAAASLNVHSAWGCGVWCMRAGQRCRKRRVLRGPLPLPCE